MFVLVLAAEADETRQAITFLIVCLVGVAVLLSALTLWYWRYTAPRRHGAPSALPSGTPFDPPAPQPTQPPIDGASPPVADPTEAAAPAVTTVEVGGPLVRPSSIAAPSGVDGSQESRIEVADRSVGRESMVDRIEVADRCGSGAAGPERNGRPRTVNGASTPPSISGAADTSLPGRQADREPTEAGPGQDREPEGLSDEEWAAIMKSAFDKLYN